MCHYASGAFHIYMYLMWVELPQPFYLGELQPFLTLSAHVQEGYTCSSHFVVQHRILKTDIVLKYC